MNFSIENKIRVGLAVALAALLGFGWIAYHTTTELIRTQDWVEHTQEVLSELEMVTAALSELEADQAGYLLTARPEFLQTRRAVTKRLAASLQHLGDLTADNPAQQRNLRQLETLIAQEQKRQAEQLAEYRQRGGADGAARAAGVKSLQQANFIRNRLAQMRSMENHLLAQRRQSAHEMANRSLAFVATGGGLACVLGVAAFFLLRRDFQQRAVVQEQARQSEERLRLILENIKDYAVILLDPEGRVVSWNAGAQRIKGYRADEIIGQHFSRFYPEAEVQSGIPQEVLVAAVAAGRSEHEGWRVRQDGSRFWADVIVTAVRSQAGQLQGFVKVTRDLTERKRAQQERDRFFDLSRDLMCIADFDGYFKAVNPAWNQVLGFAREELLTKPFIEFVHPDDRAATIAESAKLTAGGESVHFENRYRCQDGSYHWLAWNARADLAHRLIYASARDVTEQKRAAEQIRSLNEALMHKAAALEATNQELEAFAYSVSHDLRAPVRHIDGFVRLLDKQAGDCLDERSRRYLHIIADAARQMGLLIDDLLAFSRMGRSDLRRSKVACNALVHEAVKALQMETDSRQIQWRIDQLPEVEADPTMLRQVWMNLIANAIKYTRPRQPAEIEIGCRPDSDELVFFVRDNGVGFDMEYAHKLFGVFQRLHRAEEFEGTGIGLANVRRIIHRHAGRTWAEGKLDGGATFFFSLPKTTPADEANQIQGSSWPL